MIKSELKLVLEVLVPADVQVSYTKKGVSSKKQRLTKLLKNELVAEYEEIGSVTIYYHNGHISLLWNSPSETKEN